MTVLLIQYDMMQGGMVWIWFLNDVHIIISKFWWCTHSMACLRASCAKLSKALTAMPSKTLCQLIVFFSWTENNSKQLVVTSPTAPFQHIQFKDKKTHAVPSICVEGLVCWCMLWHLGTHSGLLLLLYKCIT